VVDVEQRRLLSFFVAADEQHVVSPNECKGLPRPEGAPECQD
jgi:hypothetical protein